MTSSFDERFMAAADEVAEAWNNPGPERNYHFMMQLKLEQEWPVLAKAVNHLANLAKGK